MFAVAFERGGELNNVIVGKSPVATAPGSDTRLQRNNFAYAGLSLREGSGFVDNNCVDLL